LPKSFLAVNLSESHTFHKKEETLEDEEAKKEESSAIEETVSGLL